MIRVVIADDQAMVRAGFSALLGEQPDIEVVGSAADGEACVRLVEQLHPDVVLMDVRMPVLDGIAATRTISAAPQAPRILILTTFDIDDYVFDALSAGAAGFLLKDASPDELTQAVRIIAAGDALLAPSATRTLIERFTATRGPRRTDRAVLGELTEREREVLVGVAQGESNTEIAARLFVAEQTVKTHVSRILAKLGARDRAQLVIAAYEAGLVIPGTA
ncbi:response regulator transcription factor [Microbacterium sp. HD4P20]|uniref:response regulator n=1 Tax=Microbacterium sp. HD4P20 TaxID=2864874 RepID=UPI001C63CD9D|nr:response regulator transcription factor [Microbacterium sp. HD4P20]MCP2634980.1 response regulator transcription factor [Microbacterium sp. HD4P20]